jgi:hypothetical protein
MVAACWRVGRIAVYAHYPLSQRAVQMDELRRALYSNGGARLIFTQFSWKVYTVRNPDQSDYRLYYRGFGPSGGRIFVGRQIYFYHIMKKRVAR